MSTLTVAAVFTLWVPGKPQPQGSKTRGRWSIYDDNPNTGPWRERIALAASRRMCDLELTPFEPKTPLHVELSFVLPRLANAPKTRAHPPAVTKPDLDKLIRAVFDALTGPVLHDDAQVTGVYAYKRRAEAGEEPGAHIRVQRLIP
jgi:crossover junction endodeoxyribonuclease RusA